MTASKNNIPKNRESNLASISGNDPSRIRFRNIYCVTGTERLRPKHNQKRSLGQRQRWQNKLPNFISLPLLKFSMESPKNKKKWPQIYIITRHLKNKKGGIHKPEASGSSTVQAFVKTIWREGPTWGVMNAKEKPAWGVNGWDSN